ncbi:hypothetical protein J2X13_005189 [Aminobacter aminovorans]|nr:hypothetical protein [Aminobacter aminovorans]
MEDAQSAVLLQCKDRWQKVAMVIARTTMESGEFPPSTSASGPADAGRFDQVFDRYLTAIHSLIEAGQLEVQGDPDLPRHSEVRLPQRIPG